jgi:hypothetical protein
MVDIVANQAVARVTLLSAIGGSFDAHALGLGTAPSSSDQVLTRVTP